MIRTNEAMDATLIRNKSSRLEFSVAQKDRHTTQLKIYMSSSSHQLSSNRKYANPSMSIRPTRVGGMVMSLWPRGSQRPEPL